jgi:hypothetical protein
MSLAFSVKIQLLGVTLTDASIGLSNDGTDSYLQWITQDIAVPAWVPGILSSVGDLTTKGDIRRGGNLAVIDDTSIQVINTNQFWKTVADNGIYFHDAKIEIYEWQNLTSTLIRSGICSKPTYTGQYYDIKVRSSTRNAQIANTLPSGEIVPVTFGAMDNAAFRRDSNENVLITLEDSDPVSNSSFPVQDPPDDTNSNIITILVSNLGGDAVGIGNQLFPIYDAGELYLKVTDGAGSGQNRRVSAITPGIGASYISLTITVDLSFTEYPAGNIDLDAENQSWCELYQISRNYKADDWTLSDVDTTCVNSEENGTFACLPESEIIKIEENELDIQPKDLSSGDDTLIGFRSFTPTSPRLCFQGENNVLVKWRLWNAGGNAIVDGVASTTSLGNQPVVTSSGLDNIIDGDYSSAFSMNVSSYTNGIYAIPVICKMPEFADLGEFDSCSLCIDFEMTNNASDAEWSFEVRGGHWTGKGFSLATIVDPLVQEDIDNGDTKAVYSISDDYYGDTSNDNFYPNIDSGDTRRGYINLDIGISEIGQLTRYDEIGYVFRLSRVSSGTTDFDINVREVNFVFKKSNDIKDAVYADTFGRVFDTNPFGEAVVAVVNTPLQIMTHTVGLQDWKNEGSTVPTDGWGKGYADSFLINDTFNEDGSFYHVDFYSGPWRNSSGFQILDEADSFTDLIKENVCRKSFMLSYVNSQGEESLTQFLNPTSNTVTDTVTLLDLNKKPVAKDPSERDVFVKPVFRYKQNGLGDLENVVSVTDIEFKYTASADKAAAIVGLDSVGESNRAQLYDKFVAIYEKYGVINDLPKDLSENYLVTNELYAYKYLDALADYMKPGRKYIDFEVDYDLGKRWELGKRLNVDFPNITDGPQEVGIYSIKKKIKSMAPTIEVKTVLIPQTNIIQDSLGGEEWQDTYASGEIIQDIYL